MPSLSALGDGEAVRNFYSARTILFVEGPGDKNVYERLLGPGFEADLEFRIAPAGAGQGGCRAVRERVSEERPSNPRVFGLVDGEVAASFGAVERLLECGDPLFSVETADGYIFLGAHEIENLYLRHADIPAAIARHHSAARVHLHSPEAVGETLDRLLWRFLNGAVFKYASAHFHARQMVRRVISTKIFGVATRHEAIHQVKVAVLSGGGTTWKDYLTRVFEIGRLVRRILKQQPDDAARRTWMLRVADGKELLERVRYEHGRIADSIEGHLLEEVCATDFPDAFRRALLRLTGVTPTTFPAARV